MSFVLWFVGGWCLLLFICGVVANARPELVRWLEYSVDREIACALGRQTTTCPSTPHGRPYDISTKAVEKPFNNALESPDLAGLHCLAKN